MSQTRNVKMTKEEFNKLKDDAIQATEQELAELQEFMQEDQKDGHKRPSVALAISMRIYDQEKELKEIRERKWSANYAN